MLSVAVNKSCSIHRDPRFSEEQHECVEAYEADEPIPLRFHKAVWRGSCVICCERINVLQHLADSRLTVRLLITGILMRGLQRSLQDQRISVFAQIRDPAVVDSSNERLAFQ